MPSLWRVAHRRRLRADRLKTSDALMVVYYVLLSGVLVFTLGYLARLKSRSAAKLLTKDEARRVAANVAKLRSYCAETSEGSDRLV